jgi:hypothetical protein
VIRRAAFRWSTVWLVTIALAPTVACSSTEDVPVDGAGANDGSGIILGNDPLDGSGAAGPNGPSCLGETRQAEAIGLDMYVMLDTSGSMLEPLPIVSRRLIAPTKWEAVLGSLEAFVSAPETADIGIGIQYFPQVREGVPFECTTNAECGAGAPCSNSLCVQEGSVDIPGDGQPPGQFVSRPPGAPRYCVGDADCAGPNEVCRSVSGECVIPPGTNPQVPDGAFLDLDPDPQVQVSPVCGAAADCAGIPGTICDPRGLCLAQPFACTASLGCPAGAGACAAVPFGCVNQTRCEFDVYSTPAVSIGTGPAHSTEIVASLRERIPNGLTPTGPALGGALEHARLWAEQNPARQVVTVLATDGLPTECAPLEIPDITALAENALGGAQPVRTFVIGVFGASDLDNEGQANLDALARAGGTETAIIINTTGDVSNDFLTALNRIRDTAVSCEFQLDNGASLDFDQVNLRMTDGSGVTTELFNVGDASACGTDSLGWYYVRDPLGVPLQINVCPETCSQFMQTNVRADLQVGCATRIR